MNQSILLIGDSNHLHMKKISDEIKSRGINYTWFETNISYNNIPNVTLSFDSEEKHFFRFNEIYFNDKTKVFCYHPNILFKDFPFLNKTDEKLTTSFWKLILDNLYTIIPMNNWYNHPQTTRFSTNILFQQKIAVSLGLKVPKTIISNNIEDIININKDLVIKLGNNGYKPTNKRILTNKIDSGKIMDLEIKGSPIFCQEYIEKDFELRIHVIGDLVLTCKIESQKSEKTIVDWRRYDLAKTPHTVFDIPNHEKRKMINLVENIGLKWGIIDCIVSKNGDIYFLECNSEGHWDWIESLTNLPITKSIVDMLVTWKTSLTNNLASLLFNKL